jgi:hypothetical protein
MKTGIDPGNFPEPSVGRSTPANIGGEYKINMSHPEL